MTGRPSAPAAQFGLRLLRDRCGAAAAEFALLLPLLLLMMTGMVEIGLRLQVNGAVVRSATLSADLLAQSAQLTTSDLEDMTLATRAMLEIEPNANVNLVIDVISVGFDDADGEPRIFWRHTMGGAPLEFNPADATDLGLPGEGVIWVGVAYSYDLPFSFTLPPSARFEQTAFARPRLTRRIALNGQTEHGS